MIFILRTKNHLVLVAKLEPESRINLIIIIIISFYKLVDHNKKKIQPKSESRIEFNFY